MKENFDIAFEFTIGAEGIYSNDPTDSGGETKYGVSKRSHPNIDIKNLTLHDAKMIAYQEYWDVAGCNELPYPVDIMMFDFAYNAGVNTAKKKWQESSNDKWEFLLERITYYIRVVKANPIQRKFFYGWITRVIDLFIKVDVD